MKWLIDTNALIAAVRVRPSPADRRVAATLHATPRERVAVSSVTVAELWYGAAKAENTAQRLAVWEAVLAQFAIADVDRSAGERAGELRYALRHAPIGDRDLLIAATALAHGYGVVTANVREFSRVPGLAVEDWAAA